MKSDTLHRPPFWARHTFNLFALALLALLAGCGDSKIDPIIEGTGPAGAQASKTHLAEHEIAHVDVNAAEARAAVPGASANQDASTSADGKSVTLTVDAGQDVPAGAMVSIYLLDRSQYDVKAYRAARASRPNGAWDVIEQFGTPMVEPRPLRGKALTVELPTLPEGTTLYARTGDYFGFARIRHAGDITYAISTRRRARDAEVVRVFRFSGEPVAGVRVRGAHLEKGEAPRNLNFNRAILSGKDGVAQAYRGGEEDAFAAEVHGHPPISATRDTDGWRIDLPSMGSVRFSFPQGSKATVVYVYSKDQGVLSLSAKGEGDGPLEFSHIARGATMFYSAQIEGATAQGQVTPVSRDGETIEVSPKFRALRRITMQLTRDGAPVAEGTEVEVSITTPLQEQHGGTRAYSLPAEKTDVEGCSFLLFDGETVNLTTVLECRVVTTSMLNGTKQSATGLATLPLGPGGDGEIDLGSVEMRPLPLIASGVVVNSKGQPIEGADVSVYQEEATREDDPGLARTYQSIYQYARNEAKGVVSVTDSEGEFQLRGLSDLTSGGDLELFAKVEARGYLTRDDVPFRPGEKGVKVALSASGEIRIDPGDLDPRLAREIFGELIHTTSGSTRTLSLSRPTTARHLAAGTYSLNVRLGKSLLLSIRELVVPAGGKCSDPRLSLHLEGLVQTRRLRVTPEELQQVTVYLQPVGEDQWTCLRLSPSKGWVEYLCVGGSSTQQLLWARAHQPTDVASIPNGSTVSLARQQVVTIRFAGAAPPAEGSMVFLSPLGLYGDLGGFEELVFSVEDDGTAKAELPGPGQYECLVLTSESIREAPWGSPATIMINGSSVTLQADLEEEPRQGR